MKCRNCGAPLEKDDKACSYCGSATASAPHEPAETVNADTEEFAFITPSFLRSSIYRLFADLDARYEEHAQARDLSRYRDVYNRKLLSDIAKRARDLSHLSQYREAAECGDADAMNHLGIYRVTGDGLFLNYAKAVSWFRKAAALGNADAMSHIGMCYDLGCGADRDYAKAVSWYNKAAKLGNADAMNHIGVCYDLGHGVDRDYAKAVYWYSRAAGAGDTTAKGNLRKGSVLPRPITLLFRKAVSCGDRLRAFRYSISAHIGSVEAMAGLTLCCLSGRGVKQDHAKALSWARKAAETGDTGAMTFLGALCHTGYCGTQDYAQAMTWWRKAAKAGDKDAMFCIGVCYYEGEGVEKDEAKALFWFRKANTRQTDAALRIAMSAFEEGDRTLAEESLCYAWANICKINPDYMSGR